MLHWNTLSQHRLEAGGQTSTSKSDKFENRLEQIKDVIKNSEANVISMPELDSSKGTYSHNHNSIIKMMKDQGFDYTVEDRED